MTEVELRQLTAELLRKIDDPTYAKSPEYAEAVRAFSDFLEAASRPDEQQKKPVLTAAAVVDAIAALGRALSVKQGGADKHDREILSSAVELFSSLDTSRGMDLSAAIRALDVQNVKLIEQPGRAGANSSSRSMIAVRDGTGKVTYGFFTEEDKLFDFDRTGKYELVMRKYMKENPNDATLQAFCGAVLSSPRGINSLLSTMNYRYLHTPHNGNFNAKQLCPPDRLISLGVLTKQNANAMLSNHNVAVMLAEMTADLKGSEIDKRGTRVFQYGTTPQSMKGEYGSSIPGRNVAMSRVAALLGIPHLLARSVPMKVNTASGTHVGVFMEQAKGAELPDGRRGENPHRSPLAGIPDTAFDGESLPPFSDMDILDYLCQNADRHLGNMLYSYDKKRQKVAGVMGIDNDLSFGTRRLKNDASLMHGAALDDIFVIRKATAEALKKITPEVLSAALAGTGLTAKEIAAALFRLEQLKKRLVPTANLRLRSHQQKQAGVIRIVEDDEWKNIRLGDLAVNREDPKYRVRRTNIFGRLQDLPTYMAMQEAAVHPNAPEAPKSPYGSAEIFDELSDAGRAEARAKFEGWARKIKGTKTWLHSSTENFTRMTDAIDAFLAEPVKPASELTDADHLSYRARLDELAAEVGRYAQYKTTSGDTGRTGKKRLRYAKELLSFLESHTDAYVTAVNEKQEAAFAADFIAAREMEKEVDRIANVLVDEIMKANPNRKRAEVIASVKYGKTLENLLNSDEKAIEKYANAAVFDPKTLLADYEKKLSETHTEVPAQKQEEAPENEPVFEKTLEIEGESGIRVPEESDGSGEKTLEVIPEQDDEKEEAEEEEKIAGADAPEKDAEVKAPREAAEDAEPPLRVAGR